MLETTKIFGLFVVAALCEVAGTYLIWRWQRTGQQALFALLGLAVLFVYSLIQTLQTFNYGRAFAAYGGIFIFTALLWGWLIDGHAPDRWDWIGGAICIAGAIVIVAMPRS